MKKRYKIKGKHSPYAVTDYGRVIFSGELYECKMFLKHIKHG